jgi:hypothetical protein
MDKKGRTNGGGGGGGGNVGGGPVVKEDLSMHVNTRIYTCIFTHS